MASAGCSRLPASNSRWWHRVSDVGHVPLSSVTRSGFQVTHACSALEAVLLGHVCAPSFGIGFVIPKCMVLRLRCVVDAQSDRTSIRWLTLTDCVATGSQTYLPG